MTAQLPPKVRDQRTGRVDSVVKATMILEAFEGQQRVLSVRQLSELTGIPRSTCHAIASTLVDRGLLERSQPSGGYQLGPILVKLGGSVIERTRLQDVAHEVCARRLSNLDTELHIAQFVGTGVVYLEKYGRAQRAGNASGRFRPLTGSACGLAVLMALPREQALEHLVAVTPSRRQEILSNLQTQLRRGYVLTPASRPGFLALASPVREASGRVIGAISMSDHRGVMNPRRVMALGDEFRTAALASSRMLGYQGPKEGIYVWEELEAESEQLVTTEIDMTLK